MTESTTARVSVEGADLLLLTGVGDANLVELARVSGARVSLRGDSLAVSGDAESVSKAETIAIIRPT